MDKQTKILVAYYSKTGHTERVAKDMALAMGADLEKIIDKRRRHGFWGYLLGGRDGMKKRQTEIETLLKNPADYDLIIIGTPVWGWNMVPAIRTYVTTIRSDLKNYAWFVTSGNTAVEKIIKYVQEVINQEALAYVGFNHEELKDNNVYKKKIDGFVESLAVKRYN